MDNKPNLEEIALQITLHAMDNKLIDTEPSTDKEGYTSINTAQQNSLSIIRFYRYTLQNLSVDEEVHQEQD